MNGIELIAGAIATVKSTENSAADTKEAIVPGDGNAPVLGNFGNGLAVVYLVDEGDKLTYIQNRDLVAAGVTPADLHQRGMMNLANKASNGLRLMENGDIHALLLDGHFEASLVLLDDLWDSALASYAPNGFIVALPARDVIAFCDAKSEAGIAQLHDMVSRITAKGDHLVSQSLYQRQAGAWHRLPV